MTIWQMLIVLALFIGGVAFIAWLHVQNHRKQVDAFLTQLTALQSDNRALMEALARQHSQPLIFTRPAAIKSQGWWDVKPAESTQVKVG